jgi:hypothetical protein
VTFYWVKGLRPRLLREEPVKHWGTAASAYLLRESFCSVAAILPSSARGSSSIAGS